MANVEQLSINTIRALAADTVQKANSGHPGLPLGAAAMAYELWANHMIHNPSNPNWINRDRFILSGGHGSSLLYSLLHLFGYGDLSIAFCRAVTCLCRRREARSNLRMREVSSVSEEDSLKIKSSLFR